MATTSTTSSPTREDIAKKWPEAVAAARELRAIFGDGVRLLYARNAQGEELGKRQTARKY